MAQTAKKQCPECVKTGKSGTNVYTREDGSIKCRTCGYDSGKSTENKR